MAGDSSTQRNRADNEQWANGDSATLKNPFTVDLRSLAAARILLGLLVVVDVAFRTPWLIAHYSDAGTLPISALDKLAIPGWPFSPWFLSGHPLWGALLLAVTAGSGLALMLGMATRISGPLAWLLVLSLHARNPLVLNGGDDLLRLLLLWGLFVPWDRRFSIAERSGQQPAPPAPGATCTSLGTAALLLQVVVVYVFTALLKDSVEWRSELSATYIALSHERFSFLLGPWLYQYPSVMATMTGAVYWLELVGPLLLLAPPRWGWLRLVGIGTFVSFQLGLFLSMRIGLFPLVNMVSLVPFLPPLFWQRFPTLERALDRLSRDSRPPEHRASSPQHARDHRATKMSRFCRPLRAPVLISLLGLSALWNVASLSGGMLPLSPRLNSLGTSVGIHQFWTMFAPSPPLHNGWLVAPATLESGEQVDLFRPGRPVSFDKPTDPRLEYPYARWQRYLEHLWRTDEPVGPELLDYLCSRWPKQGEWGGGGRVATVDLYRVRELIEPNYRRRLLPPEVIATANCSSDRD